MTRTLPAIVLLLLPSLAAAQVTVNPAALQQLAGIQPAAPQFLASPPAPEIHHYHRRHHLMVMMVSPRRAPLIPVVAKPAPPPPAPAKPAPLVPATITFPAGSAALPTSSTFALEPFCHAANIITINAHAPADAADPSGAMRLSLSRALVLRDALTACGVPSARIIPRALGAIPGQNSDETILAPAP